MGGAWERPAVSAQGRETLTGPLCAPSSDSSRGRGEASRARGIALLCGMSVRAPACVSCALRPPGPASAAPGRTAPGTHAFRCLLVASVPWRDCGVSVPSPLCQPHRARHGQHRGRCRSWAPGPLGPPALWGLRLRRDQNLPPPPPLPPPPETGGCCVLHTSHLPTGTTCLFQNLWGCGAAKTVVDAAHARPPRPPRPPQNPCFLFQFYLPT